MLERCNGAFVIEQDVVIVMSERVLGFNRIGSQPGGAVERLSRSFRQFDIAIFEQPVELQKSFRLGRPRGRKILVLSERCIEQFDRT